MLRDVKPNREGELFGFVGLITSLILNAHFTPTTFSTLGSFTNLKRSVSP